MTDLRQAAQAVVSAWKAGELGLGIKEFSALEAALAAQQAEPSQTIYCAEKRKPGGGQLHNLHCGWPKCNESPQQAAQPVAFTPSRAAFEAAVRKSWTTGYACERFDDGVYKDATLRMAWYLVEETFRAAQPQQATEGDSA